MANARIEEVEDDDDDDDAVEDVGDPDEMDVDEFDFARPQKGGLQSAMDPSQLSAETLQQMFRQAQGQQAQPSEPAAGAGGGANGGVPPSILAPMQQQMSDKERERRQQEQKEKTKRYQCIYPVYFDAARSREDGRRVSRANAVRNPLAREMVDALQQIGNTLHVGLQVVFEPTKCHPKDWGNPGRVRVLVKKDGRPVSPKLQNKHHLYQMIAEYLKAHPTTEESPLKYRIAGMPMPKDEKLVPPAVPRGFKIGAILPLHSPALSGGGVSDNFLKDMMGEMGGQLPPGMEGLANMANAAGGGGGGGGGKQKVKVQRIRR